MVALVRDGSYQYADSHFVLNHPRYLIQDENGVTVLTKFALNNMEECCLVFDLSVKSGCKESYHCESFLNRDESLNIDFDIKYCNGFEYATPERKAKLLVDVLAENARVYNELPNSYISSLQRVREWRKVTFKELEERTLLSERTIRRIVNGEEPGSIKSIILICLGLHLPTEISNHIIDKSPFSLNNNNQSHLWYRFVLTHLSGQTVGKIRTFLQEHCAEPL